MLIWVALPLILFALSIGCGLLVEALTGGRVPAALLPPVGLSAIIVVGQFLTLWAPTAELTAPAIVALALAGFGLRPPLDRRPSPWAAATAGGVLAVFAAPVVLSGEATFTGYIKLDDSATWMALTDRIMEHGRSLDGLAPSTYEATLAFNLGDGYPVGVFLPLGIAVQLTGTDVAWALQPYMAFLGSVLALALWSLAGTFTKSAPWRALVAFIAAQPALLYGYVLWGGIKEIAGAALIASVAALVAAAAQRRRWEIPILVSLGLVCAAIVGVLSGGGAVWFAPPLGFALALAIRDLGLRGAARRGAGVAGLIVVACLPVIAAGGLVPPTSSPLTSGDAIGNLIEPLNPLQVSGVWPSGDFRVDPAEAGPAYVLIAALTLAAIAGLVLAWRARAWPVLVYIVGTLGACALIWVLGSPWVGGKALATASPAVPLAVGLAGAGLWAGGRRVEGAVVVAALACGVLWSNALAYRDANLAPRDQLTELEEIGELAAGEGPTLMTEYNPYGARHFLREADAEGVSELRRRLIPLKGGEAVRKGLAADTDELSAADLVVYRSLVLRRSPARSRPPSPYRLAWAGEHYELWQRPAGPVPAIERLPLGSKFDPTGLPRCSEVAELARDARAGELVAARRSPPIVVRLGDDLEAVVPGDGGTREAWLLGSVRGEAMLEVDGEVAGVARHVLNNEGGYVRLGTVELDEGRSLVSVTLAGADLHPGSGGPRPAVGPLVLGRSGYDPEPVTTPVGKWRRFCGQRLDWIEAVEPTP
jgi:hypothetical protein